MSDQTDQLERAPSHGEEQRRFHRMAVRWDAWMSGRLPGDIGGCLVLDISPGGAQIQTQDPLPAQTQVALALERGGNFSGTVAWHRGSYVGIAFDRQHDDFLAA